MKHCVCCIIIQYSHDINIGYLPRNQHSIHPINVFHCRAGHNSLCNSLVMWLSDLLQFLEKVDHVPWPSATLYSVIEIHVGAFLLGLFTRMAEGRGGKNRSHCYHPSSQLPPQNVTWWPLGSVYICYDALHCNQCIFYSSKTGSTTCLTCPWKSIRLDHNHVPDMAIYWGKSPWGSKKSVQETAMLPLECLLPAINLLFKNEIHNRLHFRGMVNEPFNCYRWH